MFNVQITSYASVQNAFQNSHSCFPDFKYQIDTPIVYQSSYVAGNGRFQNLFNGRLLAQLGFKRQCLEEAFDRPCRAHDPSGPSVYSDIASLDRCTLLLREATRALHGGYLTAWVHRFSRGGVESGSGPIPLILKTKRHLEDMAKIDEGRYGPAIRELWKESACSEEHADALMDAVISLVVDVQFPSEREYLLGTVK